MKVVGVPTSEATRAQAEQLRHCADHARRHRPAGSDRRWRRRGRSRAQSDQGRRRRAAAGEDRGGGLGSHDCDRRRQPNGSRFWAVFRCRSRSIPFGLAATRRAIAKAFAQGAVSGEMVLRKRPDGHVFVTDGGHWIIDAHLGRIEDAPRLAGLLGAIPGVVEHGLFTGLASVVVTCGQPGNSRC